MPQDVAKQKGFDAWMPPVVDRKEHAVQSSGRTGNRGFPMQSIEDAMGIKFREFGPNALHMHRATVLASQIPSPITREATPNIAEMISKSESGSPGHNLDIFA